MWKPDGKLDVAKQQGSKSLTLAMFSCSGPVAELGLLEESGVATTLSGSIWLNVLGVEPLWRRSLQWSGGVGHGFM